MNDHPLHIANNLMIALFTLQLISYDTYWNAVQNIEAKFYC